MTLPDLFELQDRFGRENLLICFSGPFRHSIIEELGVAVRRYLEGEKVGSASMMDVFSVYVELAQNVHNYTAVHGVTDPRLASGTLVIGRTPDDHYFVNSGNYMRASDVAGLVEKLQRVIGLDKAELKTLYKEQMRKPRTGTGGGAGLIEMARKASEPLHYAVRPVDDLHAYFSLAVVV